MLLALILAAANPLAALVDDHWGQAQARARAAAAAKAARGDGPSPPLSLRPDGPIYRMPVQGAVMHERADPGSGLTAIGLLLASKPGGPAVAPAAGRVAYGGHFRRYGEVLILDHGHGWTTVLTGLSAITVEQGANLIGGQAIGRTGERLRIQLLHHGRAADLKAMLPQLN